MKNVILAVVATAATATSVIGVAYAANADNPEVKPWICHPVNGKGELGNGWNLINPNKASSHIDESLYPNGEYWKHMSNDGLRHDKYATPGEAGWLCEDEIPTTSTTETTEPTESTSTTETTGTTETTTVTESSTTTETSTATTTETTTGPTSTVSIIPPSEATRTVQVNRNTPVGIPTEVAAGK